MNRPETVLNFVEQGEHYGYPPCCIMAIITRFDAVTAAVATNNSAKLEELAADGQGQEWIGTGFGPCLACRATIKRDGLADFVAKNITPKRKSRYPFPKGDDE